MDTHQGPSAALRAQFDSLVLSDPTAAREFAERLVADLHTAAMDEVSSGPGGLEEIGRAIFS
ncbi:hypothetical protein [Streptomyces sp. NPDC002690]